jgi:drug/metabolite transporter (DMT)-like permease
VMTIGVREAAVGVDTRMVVLMRSMMILAAFALILPLPRVRASLRCSRPWLHLLRGCLLGASIQLGFHTIAEVPLATATVLFFTAPIFATLLAGPINGEKIGARRMGAVAVGFLGALIILRPGAGDMDLAMLGGLASSMLFALALTLSRGVAAADGALSAFMSSDPDRGAGLGAAISGRSVDCGCGDGRRGRAARHRRSGKLSARRGQRDGGDFLSATGGAGVGWVADV